MGITPYNVDGLVLLSLPYYADKEKASQTVRQSSALNQVFLGDMVLAAMPVVTARVKKQWRGRKPS